MTAAVAPLGTGVQTVTDLLPLPTDLTLVFLDSHICVDAFAADQLKVAVASVSLLVLQSIHHCKIVLGTPAPTCSTCHPF